MKAEAERLNVAILVLSKQLGGSPAAAPQAEVTPAPSGPARLLVKLTTKYNTGQSCPISVDGKEAGRIEYPSLDGYGRVMEYSSGFIEIAPGDHRIGIACTEKDGTKATSIYTDGAFRPGEEYLFHTKINIWSKALQSVSFGRAEVGGKQ